MKGGIIIETFTPSGNASELADWIGQWREHDDVQVLVHHDYRHLVAVDKATLEEILGRAVPSSAEGYVRMHPSMPEHAQRLLATLGVPILFDENAPTEVPAFRGVK